MNSFDFSDFDQSFDSQVSESCCEFDLAQALSLNYIAQGVDPMQAVLEAQLQAPLIKPFLFS